MTSTTRKRVLIGAGGIVALLIVALLALPSLIDLDARKPEIAAMVKKVTGRELVLDGPISLSILPTPTVTLSGVKFFNVSGSKNPNMVEVKTVTVKPSLGALLTGNLEVSEVTLVEPKIVLEVNAEGKPNWEFTPSVAEAKPAAPKPASPKPLSLGRLTIDNGTLIFSDSKAGLSVVAEKANFSASVRSLDGPYSVAGSATINGAALKLDLSVGAKAADGHSVDLALEAGGKLTLKGKLSELGPNARLTGIASSASDNLIAFADTLIKMTGQPQPDLPPLLAGKFTFDGAIDASQTTISIKDFKLALGQDNAGGSLSLTLKPVLAIEGRLAADRIDLDRWLAAMAKPATTQAPAPPPPPAGATAAPAPPAGPSLLASITAKLSFEVGELIYNKQPVRSIALELEARRGAVAVPKLTATLPGDLVLQARSTMSGDPNRPTVAGDFSLVGPKLRETLVWLAVDVSAVPANKLTRISLKGRMSSDGGNVQVSDAVFELDDLRGSGGITVTFSVPLSVVMQVNLDTLDLASYLAATPTDRKPATAAPAPTTTAARAAGPSVGLKAKIAKLIWNKETIGGIDVDIALRGDTLRLNDVKISNLAGARLAVRGTVANYSAPRPRPDIAFNFEAPDMDRVLKLVGATPAGLGAVTASGGVAGSLEQVALREFAVNAAGQSLRATGTLALPGAAQGTPKSAAYKGSLTLNGQTVDGSIEATLTGRPHITADLKANVLDLDKIGGSAAPAQRPRARGRQAAPKAIDTGPLRSVDGNFRLVAATLISPPLRIGNADLAATLKDGVLTISHFKGALYGGSLNFSGVVNASQPALAVDLKGDATGIYLGEMLRSTRGSNQFGSAIKVTIDGRLNATGISVRAGGTTSDQIRSSLAGGANLGGHIYVGADEALRVLGSALTGAAGGVINNTLGNALGIVGQRGLSPTALLNAISLVLNRFVNRDNPIGGRVEIAGGVLTDRGLAVQGSRATANISTRTNLGASTTDTTINFVIAEDPSAPYIITTARGPFSSPSLNVTRGTAKDPPGMTSTLPGVGNIPGIGNLIPGQGGGQSGGQQRSPIPNIPLPIPNIFGR
ncbi:MAG: AsmA family protein [Rhodospirillales bacterium]|nr:AsmA family protein [Rhodospirillales bacterium]